MKHLRIIILVLLSVLLPIQGALAATMLCADGGQGTATIVVGTPDRGMHAHHAMPADHAPAHHHASDGASDGQTSSADHSPTCQFCASGCCMASLVGMVPSLGKSEPAARVAFPALDARVPAFQSDGQERPPRTC